MKKLLRILTLAAALIVVTTAGALVFIFDTEGGLNWVVSQVAANIPGKLSYGGLHGSLTDDISIQNLRYETDGTDYSIEKLVIRLQPKDLLRGTLRINSIEGSGIKYTQQTDSSTTKRINSPAQAIANDIPELPLTIKLDKGALHGISILMEDTQTGDTQQPFFINEVTANSISLNQKLVMKELRVAVADYSVVIGGSVELTRDFPVDLRTSWIAAIPDFTSISGNGSVTGNVRQLELSQSVAKPFKAQIHGKLSDPFDSAQQEMKISAAWQNFNWPSSNTPTITSRQGDMLLEGSIDDYQFTLNTSLENNPQIPSGTWSLSGQGGLNEITFNSIDGNILDGTIKAEGKLTLQPRLGWQFEVTGRDINPAGQWPEWPGVISFTSTIDGGVRDKEPFTTIKLAKASGKLRDYPLSMEGKLDWAADEMSVSGLKINADNNILLANGTLTDHWNLEWSLDASEINALYPGVSGTIQSKGKLVGPRKTPRLTIAGQGSRLAWHDYTTASLGISADIDLLSTQPSILNLIAADIHIGQQTLDEVELQAIGMLQDHELEATLTSRQTTAIIRINASLQNKQWTGAISTADITSSSHGEWKLDKPLQYSVGMSTVNVDKGCWQNLPARLCVEGHWQQDTNGHAILSASKLPLSLANQNLPPGLNLAGTFDVNGNFDIDPEKYILGSVQFHTKKGRMTHKLSSGSEIGVEYDNAVLTVLLDKEKISADARLNINKDNHAQASILLNQMAINIGTPIKFDNVPIQGQLNARLDDLDLLPYFIPEIENTNGTIDIGLSLSGTTSQPQFKGSALLEKASAEIPRAGLHLKQIRLSVTGNAINNLKIASQMESGKGTLAIDGAIGWDIENRIKAHFEFTGKQFEVVRIPEIWVTASPDMTVDITHHRVEINGTLHIPEATIEPRDLTSTLRPSSDVIIENDETQDAQQRWQVYSLVNIILGNQVKFDGFGLSGKVDGNVALIDAPDQLTTAYGQLLINEGSYRAYGQKLTVEKGRLLFVGGPADNPGLDISATRHVENVVAGVNIRGTLQTPRLHVFSVPTMAESDALSYLVLGRPMNQASQSEGEVLFGAATSIGLAGGELLAKQVGSAFQIDEVRIESGSAPEEATLVVGKYLSPKLYVSYGVGLIEPINTFIMRYKLGSKWSLQTESGLHAGADLFYTLEK